jgi:hypothetical protein
VLARKGAGCMFPIFFSILVLIALLSICSNIAMRIRLTKRESSRDKFVWWRRGADEVDSTYEELFPASYLPRLNRIVFWLVLASALAVLLAYLR